MPEPRKYTEAQKKSARKWDAANLDRVSIALPKGKKDSIKAAATAIGESMNQYIIGAVDQRMRRDGSEGHQKLTGAAGTRGVSIPPDTLEAVQRAAERTGEASAVFIARAIGAQAKRDKSSIALGINPATGNKRKGEA